MLFPVSPVDHAMFDPVAVNVVCPQLLLTLTVGAEGAEGSTKLAEEAADGHPSLNTTLYVPAANPVMV